MKYKQSAENNKGLFARRKDLYKLILCASGIYFAVTLSIDTNVRYAGKPSPGASNNPLVWDEKGFRKLCN
jgi:hypothetical protein